LGGERKAFADSSSGRADIALYAQPVVEAGRVELLTFLREPSCANRPWLSPPTASAPQRQLPKGLFAGS